MDNHSVLGLTESQLEPIVAQIAGEDVRAFEVVNVQDKRSINGIFGEYAIPTLAYTTYSGRSGMATVFVKRPLEDHLREAHHYAFLSAQGVPVPRLYGVAPSANGREVLVLECLEEDLMEEDEFLADPERCVAFLRLMARLNAVQPTGEYAERVSKDLRRRPWWLDWEDWLTWGARILDVVAQRAARGDLGERMRVLCAESKVELEQLKSVAMELIQPVNGMVQGYVHCDLYPGNTGWRKSPRQLAVFDLADIRFQARFYDAARYLGAPDGYFDYPLPHSELAEHYLTEYVDHGGKPVELSTLLEECRTLWLARSLNLWCPEIGRPDDAPDDRPVVSYETKVRLHKTLGALLAIAGQ